MTDPVRQAWDELQQRNAQRLGHTQDTQQQQPAPDTPAGDNIPEPTTDDYLRYAAGR